MEKDTRDDGEVPPDDSAPSIEADREAAGMPAPEEERIAARKNIEGGEPLGPPSPGLLGDRTPESEVR
jgi:hypothetical protein